MVGRDPEQDTNRVDSLNRVQKTQLSEKDTVMLFRRSYIDPQSARRSQREAAHTHVHQDISRKFDVSSLHMSQSTKLSGESAPQRKRRRRQTHYSRSGSAEVSDVLRNGAKADQQLQTPLPRNLRTIRTRGLDRWSLETLFVAASRRCWKKKAFNWLSSKIGSSSCQRTTTFSGGKPTIITYVVTVRSVSRSSLKTSNQDKGHFLGSLFDKPYGQWNSTTEKI